MIQGNCMDEDCHPYYEEALQRGVQLIGLQEAFLRTIPKGQYPLLPEEILRYFTYSKVLEKKIKAVCLQMLYRTEENTIRCLQIMKN